MRALPSVVIAAAFSLLIPSGRSPAAVPSTPPPPRASGDGLVATVPLHLVEGKPVVPMTIDGYGPFQIGIDSGSEVLTISRRVAILCKLPVRSGGVMVSGTTGGYIPVPQLHVSAIRFGSATVNRPFCTLATTPMPVDGYIGAPLLNMFVVRIDPGARQVCIYRPNAFRPGPGDLPVAVMMGRHRVPIIHGAIGGIPATLEVDTGSAFPAELNPRAVRAHRLRAAIPRIGSVTVVSAQGPADAGVYAMPGLALGARGAVRFNVRVPTVFLPASAPSPNRWDGRVGAPLLSMMVLTLDYPHSRLFVRPPGALLRPIPTPTR